MKSEIKEKTKSEVIGNRLTRFLKRIVKGEEQIFTLIAVSTISIISVIFYLYSDVEDIKTHDEIMLEKGAGELLSNDVVCKSGILYYKVNNSIAIAINLETDKPFHCKAVKNQIFLK